VEWLWDDEAFAEVVDDPNLSSNFMATLGFWLWLAGIEMPVVWTGRDTPLEKSSKSVLPPLTWVADKSVYFDAHDPFDDPYLGETSDDETYLTGEMEQDLAGHLRKEAYSRQSQRSLRRAQWRSRLTKPTANRTLY
jgi:hypothetical protein